METIQIAALPAIELSTNIIKVFWPNLIMAALPVFCSIFQIQNFFLHAVREYWTSVCRHQPFSQSHTTISHVLVRRARGGSECACARLARPEERNKYVGPNVVKNTIVLNFSPFPTHVQSFTISQGSPVASVAVSSFHQKVGQQLWLNS